MVKVFFYNFIFLSLLKYSFFTIQIMQDQQVLLNPSNQYKLIKDSMTNEQFHKDKDFLKLLQYCMQFPTVQINENIVLLLYRHFFIFFNKKYF
jgi:hypothetical protein